MKEIWCVAWTKNGRQEFIEKQWFDFDLNKTHRQDGPAIEWSDGEKWWYVNGERHRLDGPAIEWSDGEKWWYVDGKQLDTEEVEQWLKDNNVDLSEPEGQMAFKLRWS